MEHRLGAVLMTFGLGFIAACGGGGASNPLTDPAGGPLAGNPDGMCDIPDDARPEDTTNPTTVIGDGRAVVRALPSSETFAVVLMDAYRTRSVPPHLVTREFGQMIAARMTAQGVFLSNVIDRSGTPLLALSIARTLADSFPVVDIWAPASSPDDTTNYVVAAWKDEAAAHRSDVEAVRASVLEAGDTVRAREVVWRRVDAAAADRMWPRACVMTLTDDRAPVDRLLAGRAPPRCERPGAARARTARGVPGASAAAPSNGGL